MNSLLKIVDEEKIILRYDYIPQQMHTLGFYDNDGEGNITIILHSILKDFPRLLKCILSEELGHHFTSVGHSFYKAINCEFWKSNHIKTELKALKWSAFHLVPEKALDHAIEKEKLSTVYELEDYFAITRELILFRLRYRHDINFLSLHDLLVEENKYMQEVLGNLEKISI